MRLIDSALIERALGGLPEEHERWTLLRTASYALVVVLVFLAAQMLAALLLVLPALGDHSAFDRATWESAFKSSGPFPATSTILAALAGVPAIVMLVARREPDPWEFLRLVPVRLRTVLLWCLVFVGFIAVSRSAAAAAGLPENDFVLDLYLSSVHLPLLLVAVAVAAPLFEELFFRGFLLGALEASGIGAIAAAVFSALAWSLLHAQYGIHDIVTIAQMGLMLAAARLATGSLLPCIAMHMLWNGLTFLLLAVWFLYQRQ